MSANQGRMGSTAGGAVIVRATASQMAVSTRQNANTACDPCRCESQPPMAAPANVPRNCTLEYTPTAVPLTPTGATLEMSDGSVASSRLNAVKNTTSAAIVMGSDEPASARMA